MPHKELPFWLVNVAEDQWPSECPEFLLDLGEKDRRIVGTWDADYHRQSWPEVKDIIARNRLDLLQRVPSELRRYRAYTAKLKKQHGSVMNFVIKERLKWTELAPAAAPFRDASDVTVLYNDWPYGIDEDIIHLVVWTKFRFQVDSVTDDLTPKARKEIEDYVTKIFCSRVNPEHVLWFKNPSALKSIHGVEHLHVMLYQPDMDFVNEITHGDVPLAAKLPTINEM